MTQQTGPRVSPMIFPERWDKPSRPPEDALATVQDAYRQTGFALAEDVRLLHEGMNLQLRVVRETYPSKYRTHAAAAAIMLWSRAFLAISDAARCAVSGSYGSVPPLARMACECLAAAHQVHSEELATFTDWLSDALRPDEQHKAMTVPIGQFMAGSTLVSEADLGAVYRITSEFSRPHFGVALLFAGTESNGQKLAVTFGDQAFHLGWAQLTFGWLLRLCAVQLRLAQVVGGPYAISDEIRSDVAAWQARVDALLARPDRCRIEEISDATGRRLLVHNVRRQAGGAPRRVVV